MSIIVVRSYRNEVSNSDAVRANRTLVSFFITIVSYNISEQLPILTPNFLLASRRSDGDGQLQGPPRPDWIHWQSGAGRQLRSTL